METDKAIFEKLIREDRAARESQRWRGTFLEYLDRVREDPSLPKLAHARLYDMITAPGSRDILETDDARVKRLFKDESLKVYNFFRDEFFGIEKTVAQIVRYFHSASLKGEESRQVLYLMGPVGSGKSSLVEKLQRGLEELRRRSTPSRAARCTRSRCICIPRHLRQRVREDARRAHRGRPLPGVPLPPEGGVRRPLRGGADRHALASRSATASASASCRRSTRTTRTPRC